MRNCAIIDDEKLAREKIELYLAQVDSLESKGSYSTATSFLKDHRQAQNLVVFLDINLPDLSGLQVAELIQKDNQIIFTTAYSEYALKGFELNAIDYLLKPFTFKRFQQAIAKILPLPASKKYQLIKEGKRTHQMPFSDIFYIEGLKEYVIWHTKKGKIVEYNSLKKLSYELKAEGFLQIHKSYIVNCSKIEYFEYAYIHLMNQNIPIGRKFRPSVEAWMKKNL